MYWRRKWQPTPVFLPGESQGWGSLVGCHLWGRTESDATEATQQQQQHNIDSMQNINSNNNFPNYIFLLSYVFLLPFNLINWLLLLYSQCLLKFTCYLPLWKNSSLQHLKIPTWDHFLPDSGKFFRWYIHYMYVYIYIYTHTHTHTHTHMYIYIYLSENNFSPLFLENIFIRNILPGFLNTHTASLHCCPTSIVAVKKLADSLIKPLQVTLLLPPANTKKDLEDPDDRDGVITHLEPDILQCEVKWALGNITMNKASGGDGIPA